MSDVELFPDIPRLRSHVVGEPSANTYQPPDGPAGDSLTIRERWEAFHAGHPEVGAALRELASRLVARGHRHLGISMLWETLRYQTMLGAGPDEDAYRLNNDFRALYARWLMDSDARLDGVFEIRRAAASSEGNSDA